MAKFIFIGTNGSMGYKTGQVYRGRAYAYGSGYVFFPGVFPFNLFRLTIPYSSKAKFEENWRAI